MVITASTRNRVIQRWVRGFESHRFRHKRTLILIQRLAFFLCPKSLAPQGFFHLSGCMERAFPLFFGCKRLLMLVSPYSEGKVGCMIKRLLVVEPVAVLYWVHAQLCKSSAFQEIFLLHFMAKMSTTRVHSPLEETRLFERKGYCYPNLSVTDLSRQIQI